MRLSRICNIHQSQFFNQRFKFSHKRKLFSTKLNFRLCSQTLKKQYYFRHGANFWSFFTRRHFTKRRIILKQGKPVDIYADNRSPWLRYIEKFMIASLFISVVTIPPFFIYYGAERVPYSNRRRLLLAPKMLDEMLGKATIETILSTENVIRDVNDPRLIQICNIFHKIIDENDLKNLYDWQIYLIDSEVKNAACAPGGKMLVYSGILDICESDDHVGLLLGHEIAHAVARHTMETIQYKAMFFISIWLVGIGCGIDIFSLFPDWGVTIMMRLVNFAIDLPRSRKHELEADAIGLMLSTNAGFNPEEAVSWYTALSSVEADMPELFSTHPVSETRIVEIEKQISKLEEEKTCKNTEFD